MKGYNSDYGGESDFSSSGSLVNGKDYNRIGSKSVGNVDSLIVTSDIHSVPKEGTKNSVSKNYVNGKLDSERYYGKDGKAYLDIDYSDHGNPKTHPIVPHEHDIWFDENGRFHRGKDKGINK